MAELKRRFPVTETLIGPWRKLIKLLARTQRHYEVQEYELAVLHAEQQAANLNDRLQQIEDVIRPIADTGSGQPIQLCNDIPNAAGAIGSPGTSPAALRCDAVIPGVGSITKSSMARGPIVFQGSFVNQVGTIFTFQNDYTSVDGVTPTGSINGTNGTDGNATFTLPSSPSPTASLILVLNRGVLTVGSDFTLSGATITMLAGTVPITGDTLRAWYRRLT